MGSVYTVVFTAVGAATKRKRQMDEKTYTQLGQAESGRKGQKVPKGPNQAQKLLITPYKRAAFRSK